MADADRQLDSATLREELDLRWPEATGAARASTDETHRVVLCHPEYDGFVSLAIELRADVDDVGIEPDAVLDAVVTAHHRTGPMYRGQELPVDLELHPGNAARTGTTGLLRIVDGAGVDIAPNVRLTIATDESLDCVLAGEVDGPFEEPGALDAALEQLADGRSPARDLARRTELVREGRPDPGPAGRLRWWRR
jgi:hypothetical protein